MNFEDALRQIAQDTKLDAVELASYAAEDDETGWDFGQGEWPVGSLFAAEGRILYALVRAYRPETVVEFGSLFGCSSKHILGALIKNKHGKLISVDPAPQTLMDRFKPAELKRWEIVRAKGEDAPLPLSADIVFEDAAHGAVGTEAMIKLGVSLNPAIILSHDAEHFLVGAAVREGFARGVGIDRPKTVLVDGTDCGLAYWVNLNRP